MSKGSRAANVFSVIGAALLCCVFILVATVVSVYYSVASVATPGSVSTVFQNVDYAAALEEVGAEHEVINEAMKSKEMKAFFDDLSKGLTNAVFDKGEFNADSVKALVDTHRDSIIKTVENISGTEISAEEFSEGMEELLYENADEIDSMLAGFKESASPATQVVSTVGTTLSGWVIALVIFVLCLFLGLIYLLRKRRFEGFIWIAAATGLTGINILTVFVALRIGAAKVLTESMEGFEKSLVEAILSVPDTKLLIFTVIAFAVTVAATVAVIVLKTTQKPKEITE